MGNDRSACCLSHPTQTPRLAGPQSSEGSTVPRSVKTKNIQHMGLFYPGCSYATRSLSTWREEGHNPGCSQPSSTSTLNLMLQYLLLAQESTLQHSSSYFELNRLGMTISEMRKYSPRLGQFCSAVNSHQTCM